jgi:transposase InsO family protein
MFISAEKANYPVTIICKVMQVKRSGYYDWLTRSKSKRQIENEKLITLVRKIHKDSRQTYGSRRIAKALNALGVVCGRERARTLMKLAGVVAKQRRKFKATTNSKHNLPVAPNLLDRDFVAKKPNTVWVSDITYIWTKEGWLYLGIVLDLFSRQVVGWSIGERLTKELAIDAFKMAFWRRRPAPGLIFHSDRGVQYASLEFQKLLKDCSAVSSMSKKGDCFDNACAESFFGSIKTERIYFESYETREEAKRDIIDYLEMFYNSNRLHSYLDYVSPRQFEEEWLVKAEIS